jgi:hypothetical protein
MKFKNSAEKAFASFKRGTLVSELLKKVNTEGIFCHTTIQVQTLQWFLD